MNIIERMFHDIDDNRWDRFDQYFAKDAIYERPGYPALHGLGRISKFYREERVVGEGKHLIEGMVCSESAISCWGQFSGTSRNGEDLFERFSDVYMLEEGKIISRITHFFRPAI